MLRRRTSAPETLRYASESPAGAGPSGCTRTSLVAQTAGHTRVAEVAQEAVARARLVPVDVRLVMAKEVTGYGVVPGFHRSAEERIGRDYDPARDGGGTGGDVARDLVARNLHATGAEKRDADPREIYPVLCGSTRARVVLDRVAFHLEVIYGVRRSSFEEHASAVVVEVVSDDGAAVGVDEGDAPRGARDVVANDRGTRTANDPDACGVVFRVGFRAAYNMVLRHSGVDAPESEDRASNIAYETVSYNSSVASAENVDHERRPLEAPDREARNAHIAHARPFELRGFEVHVAEDADSLRSKSLRAGRVCFCSGGRLDNGVVSAQLYPVLADYYVLSVNSPHDDRVARIGSVYGLLDGLARPNDRALRSGGADPGRQCNPACHQQG